MQRRTECKVAVLPNGNNAALPACDLGRIIAVQGPGDLNSLVRVAPDGSASCDCSGFRATKQPCAHILSAAAHLAAAAHLDRERQASPRPAIVAAERSGGVDIVARQLAGTLTIVVSTHSHQIELRPMEVPDMVRALDRIRQRLGVRR